MLKKLLSIILLLSILCTSLSGCLGVLLLASQTGEEVVATDTEISLDSASQVEESTSPSITESGIDNTTAPATEVISEPTVETFTTPTTEATTAPTPEATSQPTAPVTKPTHTHQYSKATCTKPQTCTSCGATVGTAIGHTWINATCTAPKTCASCKKSEGSATGHEYSNGTCVLCGAVSTENNSTNSSGQSYADGDPDNDDSSGIIVYRTPSGKRYHIDPQCGGKNSYEVTLEDAEKAGLTPCKTCTP